MTLGVYLDLRIYFKNNISFMNISGGLIMLLGKTDKC